MNIPPRALAAIDSVVVETGVSFVEMISPDRRQVIYQARREAIRRVRAVQTNGRPTFSTPQIGKFFRRDHTTILHSLGSTARRKREVAALVHRAQILVCEADRRMVAVDRSGAGCGQ